MKTKQKNGNFEINYANIINTTTQNIEILTDANARNILIEILIKLAYC